MTPQEINKFLAEKVMHFQATTPEGRFWYYGAGCDTRDFNPMENANHAIEALEKFDKWSAQYKGNYAVVIWIPELAQKQLKWLSREAKSFTRAACLAAVAAVEAREGK